MWHLGLTVALGATLVAAGFTGGGYSTSGSGNLPNVGRCNPRVMPDSSINHEQFCKESNGFWVYRKVPATAFNINLEWKHLLIDQQPYPLLWNVTLTYQLKNGNKGILVRELVYDHGGGYVTAYDTDGNYYEVKFLWYVPGKLAVYYICSANGGDYGTDYYYLLTHHGYQLNQQENQYFFNLVSSFRNQLIDLNSMGPSDGKHSSNYNYCG